LTQRILLVHVDAKQLEFADERFQAVISNSLVHHLANPLPALQEAVRLTAAEGVLFFRDLLRPPSTGEVERLVDVYAGQESDQARQMFRQSLHAALSLDEVCQMVERLGFPAASVQASSDRHWTWAARKTARAML
jgi:ubiquinone/menaquinone biosynthesis C-methylase UbiE